MHRHQGCNSECFSAKLFAVQTQQKSEDGTDGVLAQKHWFAYRAAQNAIFSLLFNEPVFSRFLAFPTWYHIQHISWYLEDFVISMTTLCLVWEYPKRMRCHGEAGFHCFFFMVWCQPTCLAHITQPQTSSDISFSCGSFKTPWKKYFNIQTFFFFFKRKTFHPSVDIVFKARCQILYDVLSRVNF